ncbi:MULTISPECIES: hypothetical protein [Streptomyces]|uniref:hypothetical protein n=1 Tax=Streptomyces TaxID=1883 RepID=UPI00345C0978
MPYENKYWAMTVKADPKHPLTPGGIGTLKFLIKNISGEPRKLDSHIGFTYSTVPLPAVKLTITSDLDNPQPEQIITYTVELHHWQGDKAISGVLKIPAPTKLITPKYNTNDPKYEHMKRGPFTCSTVTGRQGEFNVKLEPDSILFITLSGTLDKNLHQGDTVEAPVSFESKDLTEIALAKASIQLKIPPIKLASGNQYSILPSELHEQALSLDNGKLGRKDLNPSLPHQRWTLTLLENALWSIANGNQRIAWVDRKPAAEIITRDTPEINTKWILNGIGGDGFLIHPSGNETLAVRLNDSDKVELTGTKKTDPQQIWFFQQLPGQTPQPGDDKNALASVTCTFANKEQWGAWVESAGANKPAAKYVLYIKANERLTGHLVARFAEPEGFLEVNQPADLAKTDGNEIVFTIPTQWQAGQELKRDVIIAFNAESDVTKAPKQLTINKLTAQ